MSGERLIGWDTLHKSSVETQATGWMSSENGYPAFVVFTQGARISLRAKFWWVIENSISVDVYGNAGPSGSSASGYERLSVSGSHSLTGDWSYKRWYKDWSSDGNSSLTTSTSAQGGEDFWTVVPYSRGGDDSWYQVEAISSHCYSKENFTALTEKYGDIIKGRGWFTDRWWGIARIWHSYTGTEGAPASSVGLITLGSMPVFSSVELALASARSYTGTYINEANKDACFPSSQRYGRY